ncbi:unnamed protein product [Bursaphelenchus xylophilus]|uniref:(pine wood nematode) hypothetical protein n=1 Tax=Bursaphelenchus xylophilus TaxID=6326 RepID=A0A1I7RN18_BURXY|nr:unnamed protein product [Bursaphelenchus xylophilus]CAG9087577.1 unnamed protein product [Bursaphelenchus xylophilus]
MPLKSKHFTREGQSGLVSSETSNPPFPKFLQEEAHVSMDRSDEEPHPDGDETVRNFGHLEVIDEEENKPGDAATANFLRMMTLTTRRQITAAHLTKLKQITESQIEGTVSDVVISVPPAWSNDQHLALLEAGQIEGLNVLKVMNESTAVGIAYGIYKKGILPRPEEKPRLVAFVDVGHSTVSYFSWSSTNVSLHFDNVIREHFRNEFMHKYKIDAKTNPRAWQRLLDEAEKIKKQMSANSTAIPLNIERFMNDVDRIRNLLSALLQDSRIFRNIAEVELIGGSSQISFVKQVDQHLTQQIFKRNDDFPSFKSLPLHRVEPFTIAAHYENPQEIPYTEPKIGTWVVNGEARSVLERNFRCYDADRNPI